MEKLNCGEFDYYIEKVKGGHIYTTMYGYQPSTSVFVPSFKDIEIEIMEDTNVKDVKQKVKDLKNNNYIIDDIDFYFETNGHYVQNCIIKYYKEGL